MASEADVVCSVLMSARGDRVDRGDEEVQQFSFSGSAGRARNPAARGVHTGSL